MTASLGKAAEHMIQPDDVADAVEYVLRASPSCCPTEIVLRRTRKAGGGTYAIPRADVSGVQVLDRWPD